MTVFAEPDVIRTSILGGSTQLDVGLPADIPVVALIPELLAALRVPVDDDGVEPTEWTLTRLGGERLHPEQTLAQAGVLDGDLLMIRADRPDGGSMLIDDVADGVASALQRDRVGWSAEAARWTGYLMFVLAALAAVPAGRWAAASGARPVVLAVAVAAAVVASAAALGAQRLRLDPRTGAALSIAGTAPAALAASLTVSPAGAQLALAAIAAGGFAVVGYRGTGEAAALHAAIIAVALPAAVAGVLIAVWSPAATEVAAVVAIVGVGEVLLAPRLAIAAGRLPLPSVPHTAPPPDDVDPGTVDGVDAINLTSRDPIDAIAALALGDLDSLARRAAVSASLLTGAIAGATLSTGAAVVALAAWADGSAVVLAYCGCLLIALSARGRTHADRLQSAILVAGSGVAAIVAALATIPGPGGPDPVWVFLAIVSAAVGALVAGTAVAGGEYSPPAVRTAEIVEYTVLAALFPLLLWVLDAYQAVRTR
ncbi:type VII secretion integral membrane protein EccD [Gordonia neofelifaecis]|uniref:EccD-like transmembrane domain-containing protein n=1 Tax=Gordonia neofelifaecis NRRL B-59395 TaxID=644548 RepID=F1YFH6_9ACTN|nr:type VII secretion integral membrane protein EccD [Gordonia neofelifaecis]EGD56464.1 hypothetical protein SCNU_02887 [Gordonia neofelifaecis NRRL B-59395]